MYFLGLDLEFVEFIFIENFNWIYLFGSLVFGKVKVENFGEGMFLSGMV